MGSGFAALFYFCLSDKAKGISMKDHSINILKWIFKNIGKNKIYIFILTVAQISLSLSSIAIAWILSFIIDSTTLNETSGIYSKGILMITVIVFQIAVQALVRYFQEFIVSNIENKLKLKVFRNIISKNIQTIESLHSEDWMNRLTSDTVVVASSISTIIPDVSGIVVRIGATVLILIYLLPAFAVLAIIFGIVFVALTYVFRKKLKSLHKKIQELNGKLRMYMSEAITNLIIIHTFSIEKETVEKAESKMNSHKSARMKRNYFSNFCNTGFSVIIQGVYLIGVLFCAQGIIAGTITYGNFVAFLQLVIQIRGPMSNISTYLPKYYSMIASAERLMESEKYEDFYKTAPLKNKFIKNFYNKELKKIELKNIDFSYKDQSENKSNKVLRNFSMEISKGEYIAFTGASGCGKSTILKIIMCLYTIDKGERRIVTNNMTIPLNTEWSGLFAYVPQGNQLMSGTIREIITFNNTEKQDDFKVWESLKLACAYDFVRKLKEGLDTVLGENGYGLSEGQMQRLAIARAIYSDHPIILLDESTSSLDENTEKCLLNNLRNMTDKTILIVTHRSAVLDICDRQVIVTNNETKVI